MKEFLTNHIESILGFLFGAGGLFSAWAERKKRKQELVQAEIQSQQQVVDLYQEALDDLKKRYDEKFSELEGEIKQLRTNLDLWKGKYRTLKSEFDAYRKAHEN
ncbi:hypothetical protein [Aquimarina algiphila]|uniref:Uncharacterized protein n=1 Tax=Aquimarina algiphila TaxID=2047982 RepID=A0A554VEY2_9FLAO|nr:hypothetical protein [Aquimarina algiphila]TSE05679.1 hypothetical protein FOF46_21870 [Aquimarina algiphila]